MTPEHEELKRLASPSESFKWSEFHAAANPQAILDLFRQLDEVQAEKAIMREALEWQKDHCYNPFEPDNQHESYKRIVAALTKVTK